MKKFSKIIGIVLLVLIVAFLVHIIRNFIIISSIQGKNSEYKSSNNLHYTVKVNRTDSEELTEVFIKDNVSKAVLTHKDKNGNQTKMIQVINSNERKNYYETGDSKIVKIYTDGSKGISFEPYFYSYEIFKNKFSDAITLFIGYENNSYVLNGFCSSLLYDENILEGKMYINKETGLVEKIVEKVKNNNEISEISYSYEYSFNTVTDNDLAEPDISEYKVQ